MEFDYYICHKGSAEKGAEVEIIQAPRLSKPDNLVRRAPTGLKPGDEDCIEYLGGKMFKVNWGDLKRKRQLRAAEERRAKAAANSGPGIWDKVKSFFGG